MTHVYLVSRGPDVGELVDSIEAVKSFARKNGAGRYQVDQISSDPLPSRHASRRWGVVITK
jgi:hypothetical protein